MRGFVIDQFIVNQKINDEDSEIVRRVLAGSHEDFSALVAKHQDLIFAMIVRQVGEHAVARDLTQETFLKAFRGLKHFRFEAKFSSWLTRIALNLTNSYFTSRTYRNKKREIEFDPAVHDLKDEEQIDNAEKEALIASLREALSELKPPFRDVLVLCGLEGKSYEEAAAILEIPIGTVRSRLNKARLLLKSSFGLAA